MSGKSIRSLFRGAKPGAAPQETVTPAPPPPFPSGFSGPPGETRPADMTAAELEAWENLGVPARGRPTDKAEAFADEALDEERALNFPLHWRTWLDSGNYLFDLSVALALLEPRPDDLVLDFAAGTCWATEFLRRLGVRTAALDLSVEMMRRGRRRLASDSRMAFPEEAAFVVGRGQELPFAGASFDGVLCLNALHHLPSFAAALREIFRILKPGGRAVFSEPGSAHALEPVSQTRMREEGVLEKNVPLPLLRRLAREAGFRRMRVAPLREASSYIFEYAAAPSDVEILDRMWKDTLRLGPGEHARFVLEKGDPRPDDSCLPPPLLVRRLKAGLETAESAVRVRAGSEAAVRLTVRNKGDIIWRSQGRRFGGQVTLGLKLGSEADAVLRDDWGRTPLPRDIGPGEEIGLTSRFRADLAPGRYLLRFDMVVEGVTWFEPHGSPALRIPLTVEP